MTDKYGLPTPADLGAPSQFEEWRAGQDEAFAAALNSTKFAIALNCPTGMGKSMIAVALRLISKQRVCILTKSNGLLAQYLDLFRSLGMNAVSGMSNYACDGMTVDQFRMWRMTAGGKPAPTCEDGPCHDGQKCDLKRAGCKYYDAVRAAGSFTVTNYAFWLANQEFSDTKIGPYDLLIMDEAHEVPDELSKFMSEEILTWEVENLLRSRWPGIPADDLPAWAAWAKLQGARVEKMLDPQSPHPIRGRERRMLRLTAKKVRTLEHVADESARWVISDTPRGKMFQPLWPEPYRNLLFRDAKQVVFLSATVLPKTLKLLGLKDEEFEFHQFASTFPVERRLITRVPTTRVTARSSMQDMEKLVTTIDAILRLRLDRKGLIHSVSYKLAQFIMEKSRYASYMISHGRGEARQAIQAFKDHPGPVFLVSPSVSTGYDFPGRSCELQIIVKLAFPDTRDPVMAARCKEDEEYQAYTVVKELVQQTGRGMRSENDFCETFLLDDMCGWFLNKWGYLAPLWWAEGFRYSETVPVPLEMRAE